jgi:pentose-5-phosphate-3-epimerase
MKAIESERSFRSAIRSKAVPVSENLHPKTVLNAVDPIVTIVNMVLLQAVESACDFWCAQVQVTMCLQRSCLFMEHFEPFEPFVSIASVVK